MILTDVDHLSLDKRNFSPSRDDIGSICRFFSLGKLQDYEKEKGITISHSNFFVFVKTARGQYALKFYPADAAKTIAIEYAANLILTDHHFQTPVMHAGVDGKSFFPSNDHLAACFSYIDGRPAWEHIKGPNTIRQINAAMFALKDILSSGTKKIPFMKQERLSVTIKTLTKSSNALIDASLLDACRSYQDHKPLFTRLLLHNNANLNNFLVYKKTIYTLDLSHIREDYILSDLASLVISCLFFNVPKTTIKTTINDYFTQHQLKPVLFPVLNTLINIRLIKEYIKNIEREKYIELAPHLSKRKKLIITALSGGLGLYKQ